MTANLSHITSKAQVTIPAALRKVTGMNDGDRVLFILHGSELVLRKYTEEDEAWLKLAESGFHDWDNDQDEVYNSL